MAHCESSLTNIIDLTVSPDASPRNHGASAAQAAATSDESFIRQMLDDEERQRKQEEEQDLALAIRLHEQFMQEANAAGGGRAYEHVYDHNGSHVNSNTNSRPNSSGSPASSVSRLSSVSSAASLAFSSALSSASGASSSRASSPNLSAISSQASSQVSSGASSSASSDTEESDMDAQIAQVEQQVFDDEAFARNLERQVNQHTQQVNQRMQQVNQRMQQVMNQHTQQVNQHVQQVNQHMQAVQGLSGGLQVRMWNGLATVTQQNGNTRTVSTYRATDNRPLAPHEGSGANTWHINIGGGYRTGSLTTNSRTNRSAARQATSRVTNNSTDTDEDGDVGRTQRGLSQSEIDVLPTSNYLPLQRSCSATDTSSRLNDSNVGEECQICLGAFELRDPVRTLPCLHRFHTRCIDNWLKMKASCPMCRMQINLP